jgi:tetratricopeptide (TPR) repeat protein
MKKRKSSFLFFYFIILTACCAFNNKSLSQNPQDSTSIYYDAVVGLKDINLAKKGVSFYNRKAEEALNNKDTLLLTKNLELAAYGQFKLGFIYDCELTSLKALNFLDRVKDSTQTIERRKRLTQQLGLIYRNMGDYDNARRFYTKALKLNDNPHHEIAIQNNVANTYADVDDFKKAVDILTPYYEEALKMEDGTIKAVYFDCLGDYQSRIGHKDGLKNLELGLEIKLIMGDLIILYSSYRNLCFYYLNTNEKAKALVYFNKLKEISEKINTPSFSLDTMKFQLRLKDDQDFNNYLTLANEIERDKRLEKNKYAAVKFNYEKQEKEAQTLALQIKDTQLKVEKEKLTKTMYQSIAVIGLIVTVFIFYIVRIKHRKDKLLQVYNTETRISKKVHDEVANDIYHVMAKMQKNEVNNDTFLDDLEGVYNKTRDISKENSIIDLDGTYEDHLRELLLSYEWEEVNIITKDLSKVNWNSLDETKKIVLYRVLQELMTNMRKHSKASLVVLTFSQKGKKIVIDYKDNGVGSDLIKSTGLHNTENRMESINGTITFESKVNNGFKARLTL